MSDHEQKQEKRIHVPLEALRQWVADCRIARERTVHDFVLRLTAKAKGEPT